MKTQVKMVAFAQNSGWAFIYIDDELYLFRPPYYPSHQIKATERDIERAIKLQIFDEYDREFANLTDAIRFLDNHYVELIKKRGIVEPSIDNLKKLLKYVDDSTLLNYLKRAKNELIPNGNLDNAEALVIDILALEKTNPEIKGEALNVLKEIHSKRKEFEAFVQSIVEEKQQNWQSKFPDTIEDYKLEYVVERATQVKEELIFPIAKAA